MSQRLCIGVTDICDQTPRFYPLAGWQATLGPLIQRYQGKQDSMEWRAAVYIQRELTYRIQKAVDIGTGTGIWVM